MGREGFPQNNCLSFFQKMSSCQPTSSPAEQEEETDTIVQYQEEETYSEYAPQPLLLRYGGVNYGIPGCSIFTTPEYDEYREMMINKEKR